MKDPVWVLPELVLAIHQALLAEHGGLPGLREPGLLDSALARPRQKSAFDDEASVFDLAAAYSFGLAQNHPFVDGNKRIALAVGAVFLELNGFSLDAPEPETVLMYQQLAAGKIPEHELAEWMRDSAIPKE